MTLKEWKQQYGFQYYEHPETGAMWYTRNQNDQEAFEALEDLSDYCIVSIDGVTVWLERYTD